MPHRQRVHQEHHHEQTEGFVLLDPLVPEVHVGEGEVETTDRVAVDRLNGVIDELFGAKVEVLKAVRRAVHEYLTELNAVFDAGEAGREFSRLLAEAAKAHRPIRDTELAREIERMAEGVFSPDEARDLFVVFEDGKVQLARCSVESLASGTIFWRTGCVSCRVFLAHPAVHAAGSPRFQQSTRP